MGGLSERVLADAVHHAVLALGIPGFANRAAMQDQPVAEVV